MDIKIQDLNISPAVKSALLSTGFTKVSDLAGHNYITLAKIFPKNCIIEPIINELNPLGYLLPPENEISIYDISMSKRLQNTLIRNNVMYLSQLSAIPKEEILQFRNLGDKTITELEQICQEHNIQIRTLSSLKETFNEYQFPTKIYPLFFKNGISCINDFHHKTSYDIYTICEQDYPLTMKAYFIFKKNGIVLDDWHDKYIFEILPLRKTDLLWKKYNVSTVSQFSDLNEQQLKEIISDIPALSKTLDTILNKS